MGNLSALVIINFANDDFLLWDTLLLKTFSIYKPKGVGSVGSVGSICKDCCFN